MFTIIENGEVYGPEFASRQSGLLVPNLIMRVGEIDRRAVEATGAGTEVVDASELT